ncbi:MAG TPA: DNA adenine methylase [Streptosporangiaceae bacterium]|nr:DNA adenine methylase [Streptosporangiaceae bacterium]
MTATPAEVTTRWVMLAPDSAPACIEHHPRPLGEPLPLADAATARMRYLSPLRYPGAKSGFAGVIRDLVTASTGLLGRAQLFVEPFAGGASAALRLAGAGIVDRVLLADADPLVARFWQVAAEDTEWLIDRMWCEPVTLDRWDYWRSWEPRSPHDRDIAVRCLFLNRTTFSGILHGRAGPIGGRRQKSDYKIDCRFNKEALATRLRFVGDLYASNRLADVWCKDWRGTLDDVAEWYPALIPNRVIAYLDPPYMKKSEKLYSRSFNPWGGLKESASPLEKHDWLKGLGHFVLAEYLRCRAQVRWILSYDHYPELVTDPRLYAVGRMNPTRQDAQALRVRRWPISKRLVDLRYSAAAGKPHRGMRQELLLTTLPPSCVPQDDRFRPVSAVPASDP